VIVLLWTVFDNSRKDGFTDKYLVDGTFSLGDTISFVTLSYLEVCLEKLSSKKFSPKVS
jgi:hypothetical protein